MEIHFKAKLFHFHFFLLGNFQNQNKIILLKLDLGHHEATIFVLKSRNFFCDVEKWVNIFSVSRIFKLKNKINAKLFS